MKAVLAFALLMLALHSCSKQSLNVDAIIDRYDTVSFDALKNRGVAFRSTLRGISVFMVRTATDTACAPYAVQFDEDRRVITGILNDKVIMTCGKDYLSRDEIEETMREYKKYELCVVRVDSEGNVYMNPHQQEPPVLLRAVPNSAPRDINEFTHYKGNWYKRK